MKIKACELVFRYHVYFTKEETEILRAAGWIHPFAKEETDMWWTQTELDFILVNFPELAGAINKALEEAKELAKKARDEWRSMMDNIL